MPCSVLFFTFFKTYIISAFYSIFYPDQRSFISVFQFSELSIHFHRQKIIKEKAVPKIEGYMFEEHDLVRASATECMCNLVLNTEVRDNLLTSL